MTARILFSTIMREVAAHHGMTVERLLGRSRKKRDARPRQQAMFLGRRYTALSFPEIGRRMGGFDHTTVIHGVRKIESLIPDDSELAAELAAIEERILATQDRRAA